MTCSMCHAILPLLGKFETEKYSKVTTDEALRYHLAATADLRDSRSLSQTLEAVIKNWYKSSNDKPDCSV